MNGFANAAMAWSMMFPTSIIPIAGIACTADGGVFIVHYPSRHYCFLDSDAQSFFLIAIGMSAMGSG
ncbi:hypothetical protein L2729_20695 [Shewanella gelidimarina]|uniref:hypothetical protein n=1 Tax=Shewanella gelidimarina TaxID=56813 RepID=UPI0020103F3B|nr:hypothetical protein [Shewanella gelidimarina]MCL1060387.1 hypothetical protein [Shewanella gelidimarina]